MAVTEFLDPLRGVFKPKKFKTDCWGFWFFYRATVGLHVFMCLLLGGRAYFGDPIDCAIRRAEVRGDLVDNYCWVTGTWTVEDKDPNDITTKSIQRKVRNIHVIHSFFSTS